MTEDSSVHLPPLQDEPDMFPLDPTSDLPLPDPYPDYVPCPHCGEPEVEVWCYQARVQCHQCEKWFDHLPSETCRVKPYCQEGNSEDKEEHENT